MAEDAARTESASPKIDARRAYGYLLRVCRIGSRMSGSHGMAEQQRLLTDHFTEAGAVVKFQSFDTPHPLTGNPVRMRNMIVSWHPETKQRVLIACHYDTRPFPDRDPIAANRRKTFIGANDGGSGVALMMELSHQMKSLEPTCGVDFVLFDGEELVFVQGRDKYFLGSEHFAKEYRDNPPQHRYVAGVLVDMVADRRFKVYYEKNSVKFAPDVTRSVWASAAQVGVTEFVARTKHEVLDDHIPLNEVAGIPTCDVIDFDYPPWHTTRDVPASCSGATIAKVATVLRHWLENVPTSLTGSG